MKKICILIGAGADAPYGIGTGGNFAADVLGVSSIKGAKMNAAIRQHYLSILPKDDNWYPSYNTYVTWDEEDLLKAALRRKNLEEKRKISDDDFRTEFETLNSTSIEKERIKNNYPSYMGILDGKFSSLIYPLILGRGKFWQVVSCYCRAYLTIVEQVLGSDEYDSFLRPSEDLIGEIRKACRNKASVHSYYSIIQSIKSSLDVSIVTTNYTFFCEEISELDSKEIAYVHGRVGLFESPRDLCVYDLESKTDAAVIENEVVFPYLFIQSGVKPIVERKQIEEYGKMIRFMDEADRVLILGYRLNHDDNHINSIIRSEVNQGKEVVYLSFNDGKADYLNKNDVLTKLRLPGDPSNLKCVEVTTKNANAVFESNLM